MSDDKMPTETMMECVSKSDELFNSKRGIVYQNEELCISNDETLQGLTLIAGLSGVLVTPQCPYRSMVACHAPMSI